VRAVAAVQRNSIDELERAMAQTPLLEPVARSAVHELVARGHIREYARGSYVFHQGDEAPDIYFLWEGRVEIASLSATGYRQLLTTLDPGQFFGELGLLGDLPRTATAHTVEHSRVWVAHGGDFVEFILAQPGAARALLRALARQVAAYEGLVDDLLFLDLKGRVAKRLLGLVAPSLDELPPDGTVLPSVVTHADLASLAGGSRENVTRILSEFQRRGLVDRDGRRYVLKDVKALRKLAGV
jgi:CRP/FNR family transcriptional regulator, cyclic AMP receptor protein